jgi:hypothetical protein
MEALESIHVFVMAFLFSMLVLEPLVFEPMLKWPRVRNFIELFIKIKDDK